MREQGKIELTRDTRNGLHDYVENRYRELNVKLRFEGFQAVQTYLRENKLPDFHTYLSGVPESNTALRAQIIDTQGTSPEKIEELNMLVSSINSAPSEEELVKNLEAMRALSFQ